MLHRDSFRAMNTGIDVVIASESMIPPFEAFLAVRLLFEQQEQRFSRFLPVSLVSRLNRERCIEDPWLSAACELALRATLETSGLFNALVLDALEDAGYDRTFADVRGGEPRAQAVPDPREALLVCGQGVELRAGNLDLGGIVKGWTVDLAIEAMRAQWPDALVNAGGDARAAGCETPGEGWRMTIESPGEQGPVWSGPLRAAMATSSVERRTWDTPAGRAHHLIDPSTGRPSASSYRQVTAWAPDCWRAEAWAKAVLIGGEDVAGRARDAGIEVLPLA